MKQSNELSQALCGERVMQPPLANGCPAAGNAAASDRADNPRTNVSGAMAGGAPAWAEAWKRARLFATLTQGFCARFGKSSEQGSSSPRGSAGVGGVRVLRAGDSEQPGPRKGPALARVLVKQNNPPSIVWAWGQSSFPWPQCHAAPLQAPSSLQAPVSASMKGGDSI